MKNTSERKVLHTDRVNPSPLWNYKQEDDGVLLLSIYKGGQILDCTGQIITLGVKNSKGQLIEHKTGITISGSNVDIVLSNSIFAVKGKLECDLILKDSAGQMSTATFYLMVGQKVLGENNILSTNIVPTIDKIANDFETRSNKLIDDVTKDYCTLQKVIIDENASADLQNQINDVNSSLENKASKNDVAKISSGTPLFAPNTEGMNDITKNYVNTTDGYLYTYINGVWEKTEVQYQTTGIASNSVTLDKLDQHTVNKMLSIVNTGEIVQTNSIESIKQLTSNNTYWIKQIAMKFIKNDIYFDGIKLYFNNSSYSPVKCVCILRDWNMNLLEKVEIVSKNTSGENEYVFNFTNRYNLNAGIIVQKYMEDASGTIISCGATNPISYADNIVSPATSGIYYSTSSSNNNSLSLVGDNSYVGFNYAFTLNIEATKFVSSPKVAVSGNYSDLNNKPYIPDCVRATFDVIMPSNVYLCKNKELWMYSENILSNSYRLHDEIETDGWATNNSIGVNYYNGKYKRCIIYGKTEGMSKYWFQVNDWSKSTNTTSNKEMLTQKGINFNVKTTPIEKTINTLVIGDSFINYNYNYGILKHINDMAKAEGNAMVFEGTKTAQCGYLSEGRGGWNENDFHNHYVPSSQVDPDASSESKKTSSPFVFSDDDSIANSYFDFGKYMKNNNISNIDNIVFFLGMNGGQGDDINAMISKIKVQLPNVKIFVCMIPTSPKSQNSKSEASSKYARELQNISYISKFNNRENEKIYLIPTHCNVHNRNGIQNENRSIFQFSDLDNTTEVVNNGIHPTPLGEKGIAYIIYNYLAYFSDI